MAEGRIDQQWNHTAALLAMLVNVNRDPRKGRLAKAADFHPAVAATAQSFRGDIRLLKAVFVDQQCGRT